MAKINAATPKTAVELDRHVLSLMRAAKSAAAERYGLSSRLKTRRAPKPVSLPKLKFLEP